MEFGTSLEDDNDNDPSRVHVHRQIMKPKRQWPFSTCFIQCEQQRQNASGLYTQKYYLCRDKWFSFFLSDDSVDYYFWNLCILSNIHQALFESETSDTNDIVTFDDWYSILSILSVATQSCAKNSDSSTKGNKTATVCTL